MRSGQRDLRRACVTSSAAGRAVCALYKGGVAAMGFAVAVDVGEYVDDTMPGFVTRSAAAKRVAMEG